MIVPQGISVPNVPHNADMFMSCNGDRVYYRAGHYWRFTNYGLLKRHVEYNHDKSQVLRIIDNKERLAL